MYYLNVHAMQCLILLWVAGAAVIELKYGLVKKFKARSIPTHDADEAMADDTARNRFA